MALPLATDRAVLPLHRIKQARPHDVNILARDRMRCSNGCHRRSLPPIDQIEGAQHGGMIANPIAER
jgi:hypothetical protein